MVQGLVLLGFGVYGFWGLRGLISSFEDSFTPSSDLQGFGISVPATGHSISSGLCRKPVKGQSKDPKGPRTQIVYTLALKYLYRAT